MDITITTPFRAGLQKEASTMKVWPKNDDIRRLIKHPVGGAFMPPPSTDPADWPYDTLTFRMLRDGELLDHEPTAQEQSAAPVEHATEASETFAARGRRSRE